MLNLDIVDIENICQHSLYRCLVQFKINKYINH